MRHSLKIWFVSLSAVVLFFWFLTSSQYSVKAQMQPTPNSTRLAPWPTVYPPGQADLGAQEYYLRCMVCHGDRGQGLTDEWRGVLDPADQNCWQSNCHSPHHPPGGFVFPRYVPAVTGPGVLDHFGNAQNLFDFLKKAMPYQAPGSLSDKIYWQLTAYLLRSGGYNPDNVVLSEDNAATIRLDQSQPPLNTNPNLSQPSVWYYVTAGILIAGWVIVMIIKVRR